MNRHFPPKFTSLSKEPSTKAAFFSDLKPAHPRDCKNCGGLGTMIIFIATGGPFVNVPSGKDLIAHWYDNRWWAGKNYEDACPDCKGTGIDPNFKEQPASQRELNIGKVGKEAQADYSDI
jgi:hypothetical protein